MVGKQNVEQSAGYHLVTFEKKEPQSSGARYHRVAT